MFEFTRTKRIAALTLATASIALAGCGGGDSPLTSGGGPRGIFTSTNDCAGNASFSYEKCSAAIKVAIQEHNEKSPSYSSKRICEASERSCERTLENKYRPRLIGFYVELPKAENAEPVGRPLYAATGGEKGFRDSSNTIYLEKDLTLEFSRSAVVAYQTYSGGAKKGAFGT